MFDIMFDTHRTSSWVHLHSPSYFLTCFHLAHQNFQNCGIKPYAINLFINNLHLFQQSIICIHHQFIKLKINNITSLKCKHNACNVTKVGNYFNSFGFACIPDQCPSLFYMSTTSVKNINRVSFQMSYMF
jgi:hypothetical protein